ncbi:MAG TPA: Coenzyme F420 hydrogenase/dehydrogenase, beta subunit C-terminal domain [Desulfosporosinus sp.]|nr:Coenzyme F420 hydrogenase/dehydrogenase, beta subunit C-terminal domain [Desulfosporosinus sp.]
MEQSLLSLRLKQEVIESGNCTRCGLCVGMCPYIKTLNERIAFIHDCGREDGNCYRICPRTPSDWPELDRQVFGQEREDHILGHYQEVLYARSLDKNIAQGGQYGGVVSSLASYLIDSGESQAAILTKSEDYGPPKPFIARTREEVLSCAGSNYSASPTLSILNDGLRQGLDNLVAVGRPCQILAIRKMQGLTEVPEHNLSARKVNFSIGLFCFWSLETEVYAFLKVKTGEREIKKVDIQVKYAVVTTEEGEVQIPVDEFRDFIRPTCHHCFDPTAEFADVSVGSTEYDPEWNTLIIRSPKGQEVVEKARAAGLLETKPYPTERLPLLRNAVLNKKRRVLDGVANDKGYEYWGLSPAYSKGIEEGGEER